MRKRGFEEVEKEFKKHDKPAILPVRSTKYSAGYDFFVLENIEILPSGSYTFWTDIKSYMLKDEVLKIYIRSSKATKNNLILKNQVGIIDSDYYSNIDNDGNIGISVKNIGENIEYVKNGDKIAQGIFSKYLTIDDDISNKDRVGGFGSTEKK